MKIIAIRARYLKAKADDICMGILFVRDSPIKSAVDTALFAKQS